MNKYITAGKERPERNRRLVAYKKRYPKATLKSIGKIFKITKQRVSQILRRANGQITKIQG